jgi:cytochrome c-type biogenesis protein CcmH/NrfG
MESQAAQSSAQTRSLLSSLETLAEGLVAAEVPSDPAKVLAALVYYVETGSLEPPAAPTTPEQAQQISETERLEKQVADLQAQVAAQPQPETAPPPAGIGAIPPSEAPSS